MELTKQALKVENNQSFPNNNAGLISPADLRGFNEDMIDSTVNQQVYTADSASFDSRIDALSGSVTVNTGSLLVTASFNDGTRNLTFTKGDSSTFSVNIPDVSGSTINTGSFATTGSNTFTGTQTISGINNNLVLSGAGGTISLTQKPDFVTKFDPSTLSGVEIISGVNRIDSTGLDISGSQFWQTNDGTLTKLGINGSQRDLRIGFGTTYDSTNYTHRFTSSSVEFRTPLTHSLAQGNILVGNASGVSQTFTTASFATTGSNQFNGSQSISGSVRVSGSVTNVNFIDFNTTAPTPAHVNGRIFWDNTDGCLAVYNSETDITLQVGQENWTRVRNNTGAPITNGSVVRITGAQGDTPEIELAASIAVSGSVNVLNQILGVATHTIEASSFGYITTQGLVRGLNTNAYGEGDTLFVSTTAGQLTNTPPSAPFEIIPVGVTVKSGPGTSGIIYVAVQQPIDFSDLSTVRKSGTYSNDDVWLYNSSSLTWDHVSKNSLGLALTGSNNIFTGTQTFNNIVVNGTASIAYIENVTGSAKIIGDAFIVLNNDTPTERYAGIIVLDSGSAGVSASFQYDGLTNDWFYEYTGSDPLNFGVALFGPEYGTKGSPIYNANNRLVKGDGGHHLNDSNISDDGSNVSINSNTQITGSLLINGNAPLINSDLTSLNNFTTSIQAEVDNLQSVTGSYATTGSNTFTGTQIFTQPITSSVINVQQGVFGNGINLYQDGFSQIRFWSGSNQTQIGTWVNMQVNPSNGALAISSFPANNHFVDFDVEQTASIFDAPIKGFNNNLRITSNATITGSLTISGSSTTDLRVIGNTIMNGVLDISGSGGIGLSNTNGTVVQYFGNSFGSNIGMYTISDATEIGFAMDGAEWTTNWGNGPILYVNNTPGDTYEGVFGFQDKTNYTDGRITALKPLDVSGSLSVSGSTIIRGNTQITGSLILSSSAVTELQVIGGTEITGSFSVSGSVNSSVHTLTITSQTASIDGSRGNMFVLNLVSGSNTRLEVSNLRPGQTINLLVSQSSPAGGTLTTAPNLLEPSGSEYSASQVANAQDILTLATFFNPNIVYVANITNLI